MTFPSSLSTALLPDPDEACPVDPVAAVPSPRQPTMTVTVQVTLPRHIGFDHADDDLLSIPGEPLGAASELAQRLHAIAASRARELTPHAGVSTTVSMVTQAMGGGFNSDGLDERMMLGGHAALPRVPRARMVPALLEPSTAELAGERDAVSEELASVDWYDRAEAPALRIVESRREVLLDGCPLALTRREFELLTFLAARPGRVYTRRQLLRWVWGEDVESGERTVDVHVRRVRAKLRDRGPVITTIRGVGYRLDHSERVSVQ